MSRLRIFTSHNYRQDLYNQIKRLPCGSEFYMIRRMYDGSHYYWGQNVMYTSQRERATVFDRETIEEEFFDNNWIAGIDWGEWSFELVD